MDYKRLQQSIVTCVIFNNYLTQKDKIQILYYLFYQLCWDFDIEKYLNINYD